MYLRAVTLQGIGALCAGIIRQALGVAELHHDGGLVLGGQRGGGLESLFPRGFNARVETF